LRGKALAVNAMGTGHAATAVEQLLQPLAQLIISHSLQLGTITEMLKKAMVDAALKQQASDRHSHGRAPQRCAPIARNGSAENCA
jgi:hypothetical protein